MSVSSGNLDALLNQTFPYADDNGVAEQSLTVTGTAPNQVVPTITVTATGAPANFTPTGDGWTYTVSAVNDTVNTITLTNSYDGTAEVTTVLYAIGFTSNAVLVTGTSPPNLALEASEDPALASDQLGVLAAAPLASGTLLAFALAGSTTDFPACYCPGTMIRTDRGERPIEQLAIGDRVVNRAGAAVPVCWIGRRSYAGRFLRGRPELWPVRIKAGALAAGVPFQDLVVSPAHALLLDGYLVPAAELVNGATIVREQAGERVDYLHIELAEHDVIWANGAAAETFVDDSSRAMFSNVDEYRALYPEASDSPARYCAPRLTAGYELERVRGRLAAVLCAA